MHARRWFWERAHSTHSQHHALAACHFAISRELTYKNFCTESVCVCGYNLHTCTITTNFITTTTATRTIATLSHTNTCGNVLLCMDDELKPSNSPLRTHALQFAQMNDVASTVTWFRSARGPTRLKLLASLIGACTEDEAR